MIERSCQSPPGGVMAVSISSRSPTGLPASIQTGRASSQVCDTFVAGGFQEARRTQRPIPRGANDEYVTVLRHFRQMYCQVRLGHRESARNVTFPICPRVPHVKDAGLALPEPSCRFSGADTGYCYIVRHLRPRGSWLHHGWLRGSWPC